jgi:hypothetical protein
MPETSRSAFEVWKSTDALARAAEDKLHAAWDSYDRKEGPPPSAELMADASRARALANNALTVAMKAMEAARRM